MIDIILIIFLSLFMIFGLAKGFGKMLVSMLGFILTIVLVYFLTKPFASLLSNIFPFDRWINAPIEGWLQGLSPLMNESVPVTDEQLSSIISQAGIPMFIANIIVPWIMPHVPGVAEGTTAAQAIAPAITSIVILIISAILLFILLRTAVYIIQRITKLLASKGGFGFIDRVLGMALGFVKAYLYVALILGIMAALMTFSFMTPLKTQLQNSTVAKWFYNNNFLAEWILGDIELEDNVSEQTQNAEYSQASKKAFCCEKEHRKEAGALLRNKQFFFKKEYTEKSLFENKNLLFMRA